MKYKLYKRLENALINVALEAFDIKCQEDTSDIEIGKVWHTRKNNMYVECWVGDNDISKHIIAKFDQTRRLKEIKDLSKEALAGGKWI